MLQYSMKFILILILSTLCSCTTIEYVDVPVLIKVPVLDNPDLPILNKEQRDFIYCGTCTGCDISKDEGSPVHLLLVERDTTLIEHIKRINKVIKAHNGE